VMPVTIVQMFGGFRLRLVSGKRTHNGFVQSISRQHPQLSARSALTNGQVRCTPRNHQHRILLSQIVVGIMPSSWNGTNDSPLYHRSQAPKRRSIYPFLTPDTVVLGVWCIHFLPCIGTLVVGLAFAILAGALSRPILFELVVPVPHVALTIVGISQLRESRD
jgi:hypothetical protein